MNIRRKIANLLIFSMLLSLLVFSMTACGDNSTGKDDSLTSVTNADGENNQPAEEETTAVEYKADVEAFDWGGKEFKILVNDGDGEWRDVDFVAEEQNGEPINDAVYTRNAKIEEMFNLKVVPVKTGDHIGAIRKAVNAGDNAYDIAFNNPFNNATLSQEGRLYDLLTVPNLDLSQPWWDQNAVNDLSIVNKLYMVTGDIGTMYKKSIGIILFNKQMVQNYGLDSPYQLVESNKWTMDAFLGMCKEVSEDLDGNGEWDDNDRYGLLGYCDIMSISLMGG